MHLLTGYKPVNRKRLQGHFPVIPQSATQELHPLGVPTDAAAAGAISAPLAPAVPPPKQVIKARPTSLGELSTTLPAAARELKLAEGTIVNYQRHWRRLSTYCSRKGITQLVDLTPDQVAEIYKELAGGRSASHHLGVKAALKFAFEHIGQPNPFARCRAPKFDSTKTPIKYLEPEALFRLFAVLRDWAEPKPVAASAKLPAGSFERTYFARLAIVLSSALYHTGTRFSEWAKLTRAKISWSGGWPTCVEVRVKGDKHRTLHLAEPMAAELKAWLQTLEEYRGGRFRAQNLDFARSEFVFPGRAGKPISNQFLNKYLRAACRAARINIITAHGLRHSVATAVLRDPNSNLRQVQELLGHAQISTTARYTHIASREMRLVMDRIGAAGPNSAQAAAVPVPIAPEP